MMDFLIYEGKVAVALLVFYLFYRFLLKKETFHRFNRVVLVGTAVLSFLLPLCIITVHRPIETIPAVPAEPMIVSEMPEMELSPAAQISEPWWPIALTILFWAGVAFVLARVLISVLSIGRIIRQGTPVREEDGCKIIVTERDIDPFSWMRYIVLSRKDWALPHESILAHEKAHIAYGHSLDVLLVDVLSALQWFNPAIWMLRADLKELHEYEADDAVLRTGANIKEYQYLLIRKAVSKSGYSVANSFNHSILKNRITMMSKSKSPLARGLRVLYLLPLVCLAIGLQARTVYVPTDKDSENILKKGITEETVSTKGGEEVPPKFNGGGTDLFAKWVCDQLIYPSKSASDKIQGRVTLRFTVTEMGDVADVKVLRGVNEELDAEAQRVVSSSPKWAPGTVDGNPVRVTMVIPVVFQLDNASPSSQTIVLNIQADGTIESGGKVYTVAQLKDLIPPHKAGEPQTTVQIIAADDVRMGAIEDVKLELRKIGSLKIQYYSSATGQEGVTRHMPPFPSTKDAKKQDYPEVIMAGVDRNNIFVVRINSADRIFFGDKPRQDDEEMLRVGKEFLRKRGKDSRYFHLTVDRGTSYGAYTHMQSLLWQIYEEVRDEKAHEVYGKSLQELTTEERSQINWMVPFSIVEASPKG